MSTAVPAIAAFSDLREASLSRWDGHLVTTVFQYRTEMALRFGEWESGRLDSLLPRDVWTSAGGVELATTVLGNLLVMAWSNLLTGRVRFARWDLRARAGDLSPVDLMPGRGPTLAVYGGTGLVLGFSADGQHWRVTSPDGGDSWVQELPTPVLVDAGNANIHAVDAYSPNEAQFSVVWAETDDA